jgi:C4-dicarboxylate transporter DctQ subunit
MKIVKKVFNNFEGYCCALMLAAMSVIVIAQVVFRFVLKSSLPWSEELSRYLQVYITYFGCAYAIKTGAHLGIEAFTLLLPETAQKILKILSLVGGALVCALIMKFGIDIVLSQMNTAQTSPAMRIPMWTVYVAIPIGMGFSIIRYCIEIVDKIRNFAVKDGAVITQEVQE